jgi:hypothetical protein
MKRKTFIIAYLFLCYFSYSQSHSATYNELRKSADSLYRNAKNYLSAAIVYSQILRLPGEKLTVWDWNNAAFSWSASGNSDSAFYCLDIISSIDSLTFSDCDDIVSDPDFTVITDDNRWKLVKDKMFFNLCKKYIPDKAFAKTRRSKKRLLIDGGHFNFHDIEGTYAILAGVLQNCGFETLGHKGKFNNDNLKNIDLLFISNPLSDRQDSLVRRSQRDNEPFRWSRIATQPAYTDDEVKAINDWVNNGGSLFLILDHAPNGKAGEALAASFGIENRNVGTYDTLSWDPISDTARGARSILFTRSNGLIGKHQIVEGLDSITTYTGESLIGPSGSDVLLYLSANAYDQDWLPETRQFRYQSAAGRSQGVAFNYGKGRVVMLGEAAITRPSFLSVSNRGNWKFILNIIRWLAREKMD